jgi:hypothetical protein
MSYHALDGPGDSRFPVSISTVTTLPSTAQSTSNPQYVNTERDAGHLRGVSAGSSGVSYPPVPVPHAIQPSHAYPSAGFPAAPYQYLSYGRAMGGPGYMHYPYMGLPVQLDSYGYLHETSSGFPDPPFSGPRPPAPLPYPMSTVGPMHLQQMVHMPPWTTAYGYQQPAFGPPRGNGIMPSALVSSPPLSSMSKLLPAPALLPPPHGDMIRNVSKPVNHSHPPVSAFQHTAGDNIAFAVATGFPTKGARCLVLFRLSGSRVALQDLATSAWGAPKVTKEEEMSEEEEEEEGEMCEEVEGRGNGRGEKRGDGDMDGSMDHCGHLNEDEVATLVNLSQVHVNMTRKNEMFRDWRTIQQRLFELHGVVLSLKQLTNKYRNEMHRLLKEYPELTHMLAPAVAPHAMLMDHGSNTGGSSGTPGMPHGGIERGGVGRRGEDTSKIHGRYKPDEWHRFTPAETRTLLKLSAECFHTDGLRRGRRDWTSILSRFNALHGSYSSTGNSTGTKNGTTNVQCLQNKLSSLLKKNNTKALALGRTRLGKHPRTISTTNTNATHASSASPHSDVEEDGQPSHVYGEETDDTGEEGETGEGENDLYGSA